ncbi:outer membrane protein [Pseudorhodoplanes sinuspersici]|uniref:Outer membrane protein beta-barrel domain-containing protein n=1 Tax=Pseudorhodoplanes sinuspersici TaxID=1235591 RepID=A0A1W7A179_9HYPH|nr:outer membrane protein [Pseudorhodoplanes sinuspersici]ARQ02755.1 hypothetical protein CAK95_05105 [Pseudorhodoplanes sinuspersici]RKE69901.1 opacity protein-like surface antigen [Pseudorhodoplanes sinuspersici]
MKALFIGSKAVAVASIATSAWASDLPTKAPVWYSPDVVAPYNWSGFYLGANLGGRWANGTLTIPGNSLYGGTTAFIAGGQAGYNFQAGHLLFGIEGDFDGAIFNRPPLPVPTLGSVSQRWMASMAGRVGYVKDRWLVYGKVGGGWAHHDISVNVPGLGWSESSTKSGLLLGGGIEYGFKPHWTVKLEYNHLSLPSWTSATFPAVSLDRDIQTIKAGINYKFESGGSTVAERPSGSRPASSSEESEDLRKQSQNPVASLVSVPFQSNTNFNAGPFNRTQEVFNIQPVVPMSLNAEWNVISRTIIPLISQPEPLVNGNTGGIGDITQSLFLSPASPGKLIWGVGPVFTIPSASDPILGTGKVLFGPTAVFLTTPGHWVIGVLVNNQWSVGGNSLRRSVNTFLAQPFINYNMAHGWFLTTSPIITADWLAASGQKWTVPIGGGIGRVFKIGDQPVNAQVAAYYNAIRPDGAPDWQLRAQIALLFPSH